jgi:6-phosphogluconolactonase
MARDAIARRGAFRLVLAGGTTPAALYRALAEADLDWRNWRIYFGDERCLPADDAERNSVMVARNWLERVSTPPPEVFEMPAERGPQQAAEAYTPVVRAALPFDLVLLGAGEDGHTASLFPGHHHPEHELVHAVNDAPKPPPRRVTLGYAALNHARQVLFLVTGQSKADMVRRWLNGEDLPVNRVRGRTVTDVYLDVDAAADGLPDSDLSMAADK